MAETERAGELRTLKRAAWPGTGSRSEANAASNPAPETEGRHGHVVQFYEDELALVDAVSAFLGGGLGAGEGAIVIGTSEHRIAIGKRLADQGVDLDRVAARGQYVTLDAAETLSRILVNGLPEPLLFKEVIGQVVAKTSKGRRGLRAFGEMVALLWAEGNSEAAIRLEELWNELGQEHPFCLFCAYPLIGFGNAADGAAFRRICDTHSSVLPSEAYLSRTGDECLREIAALQQKALALETEIQQRKRAEERLRESEQRYRQLLSLMPSAVYACDSDGRITFYNRRASELWGREPETNGSERFCACYKVFLPDGTFVPPHHTPMAVALHEGKTFRNVEATVERPNGSRFVASVSIDPIRDDAGHVCGAINVFQDITEKRRAEQALAAKVRQQRAVAELGLFALGECDLQQLFDRVVADVARTLDIEYCKVLELLPGGQAVLLRAGVGWKEGLVGSATVSAGKESQAGYTLMSSQPVVVEDLRKEARFSGPPLLHDHGVISGLSCLIVGESGPWGVLGAHSKSYREFTEDDVSFVQAIANVLAASVQRKRVEEALRESEERFRSLVNNSTALIFVKDTKGRYLLVNRHYENLFHVTEREVVGKTDRELFSAEAAQSFLDNDLEVVRTGEPMQVEETARHEDGIHTYISIKFPLRRTDGSIYAVAGIATDITERKRAAESAARLAAIVEHSDDAIFSADLNGTITSWNAGAERLYGYTYNEAIGQPIAMLLPEGRANEEPAILHRILTGESVENYETERRCRNGKVIDVSLTVSPVKDPTGKIIGASKVARDITDKVRAKEKLEQTVAERTASLQEAIEQMEEFSYSVSHDLRAPLRAMKAYAGVLLEDYGHQLDATARGYLEKIERSSDRMNRLTQDVLAYSRVARSEAQPEVIELECLVRDVIHQHTNLQPPVAEIEIDSPLPAVLGHETTLGQSVSNLLNNAVKFVAPGVKPLVHVRAERDHKHVRLWFEDNGIGIKREHQQRIFNMFEQVHPEGKYEGTGIGLTIVRKSIEKMGGKVGVESDGQNGSRFWIELRTAD
jgi:PAS domain S-box-containing protein